ncbi:hypothetical protein E8F20_05710 [Pseudomonas sp. BN415]|uniref:tape measure protein n=1 Tax=Pseudomonas sp. BN415 TaxID=2567889 RepID=UPI00245473AB|nr:tape measure protein [Pseudomonas sp. BN415]MDH4581371.1 hypothetical protein [Pseudomonas sp. BN415]
MTEYAKLVVSVDSRQVRTADSDLDKLTQTAGKTEKSTDQLAGAFRRLAGPLAAVISAREIAQAAESYTTLTNRLRLVTNGTEELVAAQDTVFQIAQESRQSLAGVAELYQRIATSAQNLGLSSAEMASIVDTVSKSIALSGTAAAASEAALTQFAQSLAEGQLRGDEFNSVIGQAPALADAIARGLGTTTDKLRQLATDGQLTAEAVTQALLKQGDAVDQAFGDLGTTGGQALTVLGNSLTKLVGDLNDATGAGTLFGDTIIGLSQYIDSGALTDGIVQTFNIWSQTFDAASQDIAGLGVDLEGLEESGSSTASFLADAFQQMPANLRAAVQIATIEVASFFDRVKVQAGGAAAQIHAYISGGAEAAAKVGQLVEADLKRLEGVKQQAVDDAFAERDAIIQAAEASRQKSTEERQQRAEARAERQRQIEELRRGMQGRQIGTGGGGDADKQAKEAQKAAERLRQLYDSNELALSRQVALFGQTTEAARVRYEVENGELSKLNTQQQEHLIGLAEEIDKLNQRKELQERVRQIEESTWTDAQRALADYQAQVEDLWKAKQELGWTEEQYQRRVDAVTEAHKRQTEEAKTATGEWDEITKNAVQSFQNSLSSTIKDTITGDFDDIGKRWVDLLNQMAADALAAQVARSLFGEAGGGAKGSTGAFGAIGGWLKDAFTGSGGGTGLAGLFSSFAGLFDRGGPIPAGGWGIVGERGPEIVRGPANVTGRQETAQMMGANTTIIKGPIVFPGITSAKEADKATAVAARNLGRIAQGTQRYM